MLPAKYESHFGDILKTMFLCVLIIKSNIIVWLNSVMDNLVGHSDKTLPHAHSNIIISIHWIYLLYVSIQHVFIKNNLFISSSKIYVSDLSISIIHLLDLFSSNPPSSPRQKQSLPAWHTHCNGLSNLCLWTTLL